MIVSFSAARAGCHLKIEVESIALQCECEWDSEDDNSASDLRIFTSRDYKFTFELHWYSVQRPPWGQKKVSVVERLKEKWMYGLFAKKMASVERWPLLEVWLYIESFLRATFICISLQVFIGNSDRNTIKGNVFDPPMKARYVRIYPTAWVNHISLRAEFYGLPLRKCYLTQILLEL